MLCARRYLAGDSLQLLWDHNSRALGVRGVCKRRCDVDFPRTPRESRSILEYCWRHLWSGDHLSALLEQIEVIHAME